MKVLKWILIVLGVIIVLPLVIALFVPKQYTVSVSTIIKKPAKEVFDYVKIIRNQEKYSVWVMEDPNAKMEYIGTDGTVGFIAKWNSKDDNVGEGQQQITAITDSRVDVDLTFVRPFEGKQKAATIVKSLSESETEVTNEFYGNDPYPMNLMSLIGKSFIRDAQTKNMANLKKILEAK